MRHRFALAGCLCIVLSAGAASAASVEGDYMEARTADVYTGPCFSNSEVFLTGHQAVMAWSIRSGTWNGQDLRGLTVAAALRGTTTFSEDKPELARSIVIVDQRATAEQRDALVDLARHLAGDRLGNIAGIETAQMTLKVERTPESPGHTAHGGMPKAPRASFWAAGLAEIATRPLTEADHACGNEVVAYSPLSKGVTVTPAFTIGNRFQGSGLDTTWSDPNCRSSFVGHFAY